MRRDLTDEIIYARELYIMQGVTTLTELAKRTGVRRQTLSRYAKMERWAEQRAEQITTSVGIAHRLKSVAALLMDEVEKNLKEGKLVNDLTLKRIEKIASMTAKFDQRYDEKGAIILANKKLIAFAQKTKRMDLLKLLNEAAPEFYRSLDDE
jgi:hypothetical protein